MYGTFGREGGGGCVMGELYSRVILMGRLDIDGGGGMGNMGGGEGGYGAGVEYLTLLPVLCCCTHPIFVPPPILDISFTCSTYFRYPTYMYLIYVSRKWVGNWKVFVLLLSSIRYHLTTCLFSSRRLRRRVVPG